MLSSTSKEMDSTEENQSPSHSVLMLIPPSRSPLTDAIQLITTMKSQSQLDQLLHLQLHTLPRTEALSLTHTLQPPQVDGRLSPIALNQLQMEDLLPMLPYLLLMVTLHTLRMSQPQLPQEVMSCPILLKLIPMVKLNKLPNQLLKQSEVNQSLMKPLPLLKVESLSLLQRPQPPQVEELLPMLLEPTHKDHQPHTQFSQLPAHLTFPLHHLTEPQKEEMLLTHISQPHQDTRLLLIELNQLKTDQSLT